MEGSIFGWEYFCFVVKPYFWIAILFSGVGSNFQVCGGGGQGRKTANYTACICAYMSSAEVVLHCFFVPLTVSH